MAIDFRYKDGKPNVWFHRRRDFSNQYCLYCGSYVGQDSTVESNKEHLLAREFVPNKYLESSGFSFIFRCCITCNERKSNIERHLSTITLVNSSSREADWLINNLALHKAANDFHPLKKGKLIKDSGIAEKIEINNCVIKSRIGFTAPPQPVEDYVIELAYRHIQGLFSLLTSENPLTVEGTCLLPFENFHIFGVYPKNDWGNPQVDYFFSKTKRWPVACEINTAKGFFKALMLRSMEVSEGWMWALEWNKHLRILGALINEAQMCDVYPDIPEINWSTWVKDSKGESRFRKQIPLTGNDLLFRNDDK